MKLLKSKKILFLLIIILILIVVLKTTNLRPYAFKYLPDSAKIIIKVLLKEAWIWAMPSAILFLVVFFVAIILIFLLDV